jgi:hypothetical protein
MFEPLEARGMQGCLISAQALQHVPGRAPGWTANGFKPGLAMAC